MFPHLSLPSQLLSTKKVLDAACSKCLRLVTQPITMETTPPCVQPPAFHRVGIVRRSREQFWQGLRAVFSEADKSNRSSKFGALLFYGMRTCKTIIWNSFMFDFECLIITRLRGGCELSRLLATAVCCNAFKSRGNSSMLPVDFVLSVV